MNKPLIQLEKTMFPLIFLTSIFMGLVSRAVNEVYHKKLPLLTILACHLTPLKRYLSPKLKYLN